MQVDKLLLKFMWQQPASYKEKTILRRKDNVTVDSSYM